LRLLLFQRLFVWPGWSNVDGVAADALTGSLSLLEARANEGQHVVNAAQPGCRGRVTEPAGGVPEHPDVAAM
jgi:hypothetical protein